MSDSPTLLVNHATSAKALLHLIWPNGLDCEHRHARDAFAALERAEAQADQLAEALSSMCHRYLRVENGKLHHDCMSAGEAAFDALSWPDTGQPMEKECLCEVEGCGQGWTAGVWGKDGKYHTLCGAHFSEWLKSGKMETDEQADNRWVADTMKTGATEAEARAELAKRKEEQAQWAKLREKMPEPETPLPQEPQKTAAEKVKALADAVVRMDNGTMMSVQRSYTSEDVTAGDGEHQTERTA